MFADTFGQDVDDEMHQYCDGTSMSIKHQDDMKWIVQRGAPPAVSMLEQSLQDVKAMFQTKFLQDVEDDETHEYVDGTSMSVRRTADMKWIVHRGAPPAMSSLEQSLLEVKAMYQEKFGQDVDTETHQYTDGTMNVLQKNGLKWIVHRGNAPTVSNLEQRLDEAKALYKAKYGEDIDIDSESDEELRECQPKVAAASTSTTETANTGKDAGCCIA